LRLYVQRHLRVVAGETMRRIVSQIILVVAAISVGSALYMGMVTGVRYTVTFTVTLDDRAYAEGDLTAIREAAKYAFFLKGKQEIGAFEGKPLQFVVRLSDVTRDDLMWMMSQQLSHAMSPLKSGVPEAPDKSINIRCVPYLPTRSLALMVLGLATVLFLGWSFAQARRNSERKANGGKPQPPPAN
jgi:hypothetical protein